MGVDGNDARRPRAAIAEIVENPQSVKPGRPGSTRGSSARLTIVDVRTKMLWGLAAVAILAGACGGADPSSGASGQPVAAEEAAAGTRAPTAPATAAATVPTSTTVPCVPAPLERRAATVLVAGIGNATAADAPLPAQLATMGIGGVILLGANVVDTAQVQALIDGMRFLAAPGELLVTVDEEGGRVSRLRSIYGTTESARTLGQRPLPEISAVATARGATLRELGFDLSWAPVVDADGGPSRARSATGRSRRRPPRRVRRRRLRGRPRRRGHHPLREALPGPGWPRRQPRRHRGVRRAARRPPRQRRLGVRPGVRRRRRGGDDVARHVHPSHAAGRLEPERVRAAPLARL